MRYVGAFCLLLAVGTACSSDHAVVALPDSSGASTGPVNPIPPNLWRPDPSAVPGAGNYVYLASDPGDYVGLGLSQLYLSPGTPVSIAASGGEIDVTVGLWNGTFVAMRGTLPMKVGYYGNLHRWPLTDIPNGGLDWTGYGRGCNTLTGWFAIDRLAYDGTTLTELDMRFEQHCDEGAGALHGAIHWVR